MTRRVSATVDLAAIRHNLDVVRRTAPGCKVMAALKADAYGHGAAAVASAIDANVDAFAVAALEEAVGLTDAGVESPIVLLEGFLDARELVDIATRGDVCVLHHDWQLRALEQASLPWPIPVWFKLDTGMNRLGFAPNRARELLDWSLQQAVTVVGWMTHLARADDLDDPETAAQIDRFTTATQGLPGERTIANSGGILGWPEARADWVRPGLMLYGASPIATKTAAEIGLKPAMTVCSRIISIKPMCAGEAIGYGGAWRASADTRVATIAAGYGDGYPRHANNGTPVLLGDTMLPLIGRVSMDLSAVDLGTVKANIGDVVTLWGDGLPVEQVASHTASISYDLLCGLTQRVQYRHANMT